MLAPQHGDGERAAAGLADVLAAHDAALARLQRGRGEDGPFVLGTIENLVDPVLPDLLGVVREQLGERPVQLRVDRSLALVTMQLRWWASPALADRPPAGLSRSWPTTRRARSASWRSGCWTARGSSPP